MGKAALLITLLLPLVGTLAVLLFNRDNARSIRNTTLGISLLAFICSLPLFFEFDRSQAGFQFYMDMPWIKSLDVGFRFGLDGMSLLMVLLTVFIMPIAIYSSFGVITKREKEYYAMMLFLQFAMTLMETRI